MNINPVCEIISLPIKSAPALGLKLSSPPERSPREGLRGHARPVRGVVLRAVSCG
jgi:hypothetical protein